MNPNRLWNLTLTLPDEPERSVQLPQAEMVSMLQAVMRGEAPAEAEVHAEPLAA